MFVATSPGTRLARSRTETKLPLVTASKSWRKLSVASLYLARPVQHIRGQLEYNTFRGRKKYFADPLPVIFTKARFIAVFVKYKREAPPKCNNLRQLPASKTETGDKPASCTLSGGKTQTRIATRGPGHGSKPTYPCCKTPFEVFSARRWAPTGVKHGPLVCGASVAAAKKTRGEVYP